MKLSYFSTPIGLALAGVGLFLPDALLILSGCGIVFFPATLHAAPKREPEELPEARAMRKEDEAIEREKTLFVKGDLTQEEFEASVQRILDRRPTDDSYEAKIEARERRLKRGNPAGSTILDHIASGYAVPSHTMGCKECHGMGMSANEQRRIVSEYLEPHPNGSVVRRRQYEEMSIHPMDEPYPVEVLTEEF